MKRAISVFLLFFAVSACAQGRSAEQPNTSATATNNHDSSDRSERADIGKRQDDDFGCLAGIDNKLIAVFFPVQDKSQFSWTWNANTTAPAPDNFDDLSPRDVSDQKWPADIFDYTWIAEPGHIDKKGHFIPGHHAIGFAHWNSGAAKETTGSLEALINDRDTTVADIYLNNPDRNKRAAAAALGQFGKIRANRFFYKDGVSLISRDAEAKTLLLSGAATHMRLTVKTPYPSQSYSCITTINYVE